MQEINKHNFTDHQAVSQELVKFLLLNTLVEAVDILTSKMKLTKDKISGTVSTQLKDVIKKLVKLERKE